MASSECGKGCCTSTSMHHLLLHSHRTRSEEDADPSNTMVPLEPIDPCCDDCECCDKPTSTAHEHFVALDPVIDSSADARSRESVPSMRSKQQPTNGVATSPNRSTIYSAVRTDLPSSSSSSSSSSTSSASSAFSASSSSSPASAGVSRDFRVHGMTCTGCATLLDSHLRKQAGIKGILLTYFTSFSYCLLPRVFVLLLLLIVLLL